MAPQKRKVSNFINTYLIGAKTLLFQICSTRCDVVSDPYGTKSLTTLLKAHSTEELTRGGSQAAFQGGSEATQNSTTTATTQSRSLSTNEASTSSVTQNSSQAIVEAGRLLPPLRANRPNAAPALPMQANSLPTEEAVVDVDPKRVNSANVVNYHWERRTNRRIR